MYKTVSCNAISAKFTEKHNGVFKKAADGQLPWTVQFITYMDIPVRWANFAIWTLGPHVHLPGIKREAT
jgi:hypothetical protein